MQSRWSPQVPYRSAAFAATAAAPRSAEDVYVLRLTIDSAAVTSLRQLAMRVCGDALEFMRIAVGVKGQPTQVWLCVRLGHVALLRETLQRQLPGVQLGSHRDQRGAQQ